MRLRFLHIPKTAGSTFTSILYRKYVRHQTFCFTGMPSQDMERFNSLSKKQQQEIQLFIGHAPIITGIEAADRAPTITFFRNPIERVKSFCQHVYEGKSPHLVARFPPQSFCLDDFLQSDVPDLSNLQTKMLINSLECAAPNYLQTMTEHQALDLAKCNLASKIDCFGIQEFFDASILQMAQRFGWRLPIYASKNTKQNNRNLIFAEHHLQWIRQANHLDIQLYQYAKQKWRKEQSLRRGAIKRLHFFNTIANPMLSLTDGVLRKYKRRND